MEENYRPGTAVLSVPFTIKQVSKADGDIIPIMFHLLPDFSVNLLLNRSGGKTICPKSTH
jgi:hypothetical protein